MYYCWAPLNWWHWAKFKGKIHISLRLVSFNESLYYFFLFQRNDSTFSIVFIKVLQAEHPDVVKSQSNFLSNQIQFVNHNHTKVNRFQQNRLKCTKNPQISTENVPKLSIGSVLVCTHFVSIRHLVWKLNVNHHTEPEKLRVKFCI